VIKPVAPSAAKRLCRSRAGQRIEWVQVAEGCHYSGDQAATLALCLEMAQEQADA